MLFYCNLQGDKWFWTRKTAESEVFSLWRSLISWFSLRKRAAWCWEGSEGGLCKERYTHINSLHALFKKINSYTESWVVSDIFQLQRRKLKLPIQIKVEHVPSKTHRVSFLRVFCLSDDTLCCVNATVMDELTLWPFLSSDLLAASSRESEGKAR